VYLNRILLPSTKYISSMSMQIDSGRKWVSRVLKDRSTNLLKSKLILLKCRSTDLFFLIVVFM